jgi:hypothetical protein
VSLLQGGAGGEAWEAEGQGRGKSGGEESGVAGETEEGQGGGAVKSAEGKPYFSKRVARAIAAELRGGGWTKSRERQLRALSRQERARVIEFLHALWRWRN